MKSTRPKNSNNWHDMCWVCCRSINEDFVNLSKTGQTLPHEWNIVWLLPLRIELQSHVPKILIQLGQLHPGILRCCGGSKLIGNPIQLGPFQVQFGLGFGLTQLGPIVCGFARDWYLGKRGQSELSACIVNWFLVGQVTRVQNDWYSIQVGMVFSNCITTIPLNDSSKMGDKNGSISCMIVMQQSILCAWYLVTVGTIFLRNEK